MASDHDRSPDRSPNRGNESRRILDRVEHETARGWGKAPTTARRVGSHLAADDADRVDTVDQDDRIEHIGTRIGRLLGAAITVGLFVTLAWLLFGGA